MSVPMALVDYIPTILFLLTILILQKDLYSRLSGTAFTLFAGGGVMVFTAGFYKATWKLLYGAGICDFEKLSACFFPMQATGFLLLGISVLGLLRAKRKSSKTYAAAAVPAVFSGTMVFVGVMVAGLLSLMLTLSTVARRLGKKFASLLFLIAAVLMLGMGYLATKDFEKEFMNWLAEGVNIAGQLCFFLAALLLHRAGLKDYEYVKPPKAAPESSTETQNI